LPQVTFFSVSTLEIIFCAFLPLKGVLKRVAENYFVKVLIPFIGVRRRIYPDISNISTVLQDNFADQE
jgi:hypothetical protein